MTVIVNAEYLGSNKFDLEFSDGSKGIADLSELLSNETEGVFLPLRDESILKNFSISHGTLCWPGDLDLAPEYLFYLAFRDSPALHDLFVRWGYESQAS